MSVLLRFSIYGLIFFISWSAVFSVTELLPVYMLILIFITILGLLYSFTKKYIIHSFFFEDIFIIIFYAQLCFFSLIHFNEKTINYLIAYFIAFIICILFLPFLIINLRRKVSLLKVNYYTFIFVSIFLILEFIINNVLKLELLTYLPGYEGKQALFGPQNLRVYRNYGFAIEPGYVAFYYVVLGPLAWQYAKNNKYYILTRLLFVLVFLFLFSAGGIVILILSLLSAYFFEKIYTHKVNIKKLSLGMIFIFIILCVTPKIKFFNGIYEKITLSQKRGSSEDRLSRWKRDFKELTSENFLLGKGLGKTSLEGKGSSTNWYLFMANEVSVFPLLTMLVFLILKGRRLFIYGVKRNNQMFFIGFIAGVMYYMIISVIQFLPLWILIMISSYTIKYEKRNENITYH